MISVSVTMWITILTRIMSAMSYQTVRIKTWITFLLLFGQLLGPILGPFWDLIGPRRGQDEPNRAIQSFKGQYAPSSKTFKQLVFKGFWGPKASQESLKRPKKVPKRHPKSSKASKKGSKNWSKNQQVLDPFWDHFGVHFGTKKW